MSEAGDRLQARQSGSIDRSPVWAKPAEPVRGQVAVRQSARDVTVVKSVGTALEDLAAAQLVWQQAR